MTLQEQIDLIIGPQAPTGSYFDTTLVTKAKLHGEACPANPPAKPLSPVEPRRQDFTDDQSYQAAHLTWTTVPVIKAWLDALNSFVLLQYYDLPLSLYTAYARTQDPAFLALANKCADAWWKHPTWIGEGEVRLWPDNASPPPRHAGIGGFILRAMNGRFEMWDWIHSYTSYFFYIYVKRRLTQPIYDLREGAFVLRFATWLSQVLPDSFPTMNGGTANGIALRALYMADIEAATVQYFGRNQRGDGAWTWNDEFKDTDGGSLVGITQPFMVGLLLRALCDAHQVVSSDLARTSIKVQILNGCRHLYSDGPYSRAIATNFGVETRGFHYFYHGGTSVNPTRYVRGNIPSPWLTTERWHVESARQAISTIAGSFAYAYKISGDDFFKTAGNELFDSAYGGRDGFRAMMADTAKNFNQHVFGSSSFTAWLGGAVTPAPLPAPAPAPAPTPPPEPSVPVVTLNLPLDGSTLSGTVTVTATVTDSGTINIAYLIVDDVVINSDSVAPYSFSLDTTKLNDGNHSLFVRAWNAAGKAGDSKKISVVVANTTPAPTPTPTPVPTPPATRSVTWPKQVSKQNPIIEAQWKEKFRLKSVGDGSAVFEKVG